MPTPKQARLRYRLEAHHLPLLLASITSVGILYVTRPYKDVITKISFATAYPALVFLAVTLLIGPWNVLRKKRNPVSGDLRRDIGIWAGILGVLHSVIGQNVHMRGRPWLYYVYDAKSHHTFPLRHDLFGLTNFTGLFGFLLLAALLATSNDYSLRALGTPRWKQLQRWNYAVFAFVAIHALCFQTIEKQKTHFVVFVIINLAIGLIFQLFGFYLRRKTHSQLVPT